MGIYEQVVCFRRGVGLVNRKINFFVSFLLVITLVLSSVSSAFAEDAQSTGANNTATSEDSVQSEDNSDQTENNTET
jgi:hypothetical protein